MKQFARKIMISSENLEESIKILNQKPKSFGEALNFIIEVRCDELSIS
jgi:hypothetical protein